MHLASAAEGKPTPELTPQDEVVLAWELRRLRPEAWTARRAYAPGGVGPYPLATRHLLRKVQLGLQRLRLGIDESATGATNEPQPNAEPTPVAECDICQALARDREIARVGELQLTLRSCNAVIAGHPHGRAGP